MTFASFYILALLSPAVGIVWWWFDSRVHLLEVLLVTSVAYSTTFITHWAVARGMTSDMEVWSGEVTHVVFHPEWEERYTVTTSEEDDDGNVTYDTSTYYDTHEEEWKAHTTLDQEIDITVERYRYIGQLFGGESKAVKGDRTTSRDDSEMVSGDPYDYVVANRTRHVVPVTRNVRFENRVKASPSVFSYVQLSEEQAEALPDYPYTSPWVSGRVIGAPVSIGAWDAMMAKLGPEKKVNLILVRLPSFDQALQLEAKWVGGKKNDIVMTYGADWSYVFGWTEHARVKRELETLLLLEPVNDALLPEIEALVREHYELVDWSKFDYLDLQPRGWHLLVLVLVMVFTQGLAFVCITQNDYDCELDFR
jgi:hypothetical protein